MRSILLLNLISVLLLAPLCNAGQSEFSHGVAKIDQWASDGAHLRAVVRTGQYTAEFPYKDGFRWGAEYEMPRSVVTSINFRIGVDEVFIPMSAYSDLLNPTGVAIEETKTGYLLVICGGDAATSYQAKLLFNEGKIRKRKVVHGEFPDDSWEETVYSFNTGSE